MSIRMRFLWAWSCAGLLEIPFLAPLFSSTFHGLADHFWIAIGLHGLAVRLLWIGSLNQASLNQASPKKMGLLFFPGLGWILAGFLFWTRPIKQEEEKEEELFGYANHILPEKIWPRALQKVRVLHELDFMSLSEVLTGDDIDLKRGAIERLTQLRTPEAIGLLLEQRSNPSYEVRFYATSALARIKKELDEELESAKEEMKKDIYKVSARLLLAKRYLFYAHSQLLDPETAQTYEQEALHHLRFIVKTPHASAESYWLLVEIYLGQKQWEQALEMLEKLKPMEQGNIQGDLERFEKTHARLYFLTGRYQDLTHQLQDMKPRLDREWLPVANWWGVT